MRLAQLFKSLFIITLLSSCDGLFGELEPSNVLGNAGTLVGDRWSSEALRTPEPDQTFTEIPTVQWADYQPIEGDDPNVFYLLHIGQRNETDEYEATTVVPYIAGTSFDLSRLPIEPNETYYAAAATRAFTVWNEQDEELRSLQPSELDPPNGVFDPDLWNDDIFASWMDQETFPVPFTYTGPSYRFEHPVTGAGVTIDSANSATVTWTAPGSADLVEIHVTQFPGPPEPFIVDPDTSSSISLDNLSPYFAYVVWIQTVADNGDISDPAVVAFSPGDSTVDPDSAALPYFWLSTPNGLVPGSRLSIRGLDVHTPDLHTFDFRKTVSDSDVSEGAKQDWNARLQD